jgi:hypothetical protein
MKSVKYLLYVAIGMLFNFCSSQKEIKALPFKTQEVYSQAWIGGQELTGSGTNLFIKFSEPFSANFLLKKAYYKNKEANFEKLNDGSFVARFYQRPNNPDVIVNENFEDEKPIPSFCKELQPNEAIVEFEQDHKMERFKLKNIKEKELLAYPSARPRN